MSNQFKTLDDIIGQAFEAARSERELGFEAQATLNREELVITIDTRITRDSRRSNNGGDYSFWLDIRQNEYGHILVEERCTCDFWQPEDEPQLFDGVSWDYVLGCYDVYSDRLRVPQHIQ